ncbi:PIN domain-containing protein [Stigmatella erecta]|uniref:PIN domain-containing protein n=1 Tax=Stigmatella erecta TaxID=83460 RepID=A0A1I0L026_9BACT|nr:PIN domain-containing protein [Stigmatella erecta]SEU31553.1 PIN domain-containing protein [Stigmatella erecta]
MPLAVVYDACVLHPAPLRDLLVRLGRTQLYQAKWSRQILDECFRSILRQRRDLTAERLAKSRQLLEQAILDVEVTGHEELIDGITGMPDPDDRHVVAAAIRCGAQRIVTFNLKDFPRSALERYGIEAQHPDDFVQGLISWDAAHVTRVVREQTASLKNPPKTLLEVLDRLSLNGLAVSAALLKKKLGVF